MQVVVLSGGLGTRLKALDFNGPKAMVPVCGKPFVEHQLGLLERQGFREVLMCTGHMGEQIEAFVGDGSAFGMHVQYARENPRELLGTGGALVHAGPQLADEFLLIYGDSYLPTDFRAMMEWSRRSSFPAVMSVFRNAGRWDRSNARVEGNRVSYYSKKAAPGECDYIDYGLSYFKREVFEAYAARPFPLDLAVVQQVLCGDSRLGAFEVGERFYEVGTPEGIAQLEVYFEGSAVQ